MFEETNIMISDENKPSVQNIRETLNFFFSADMSWKEKKEIPVGNFGKHFKR